VNAQTYEIVGQIGQGGMASVHLAVHVGSLLEQLPSVALKRMHPHMRSNPVAARLFAQEARLAGLISHPNCLAARAVCEVDGATHLVMEYVPGICVRQLLRYSARRGASVPLGLCARILLDVLDGLHAVHWASDTNGCLGIVHQDLSLPNLLIGNDGACRIVDFGAAKVRAWKAGNPPGVIVGTLGYAAPERFDVEDVTDQRTDIYALGVVLWELLAGRRLFNDALNTQALVEKVRRSDVRLPSMFCPVPSAVEDVCMLCPARRFAGKRRPRVGAAARPSCGARRQ
jgi:eukaryotic-like serine/threonine-protein kinase